MKEDFMDIINDLVDMGDCVYDHHGNCQAHGWFSDKECPHSRAKRVLANAIPISEAPDVKRWCDNQDVVDGKKVCEYLGVEGSCTHLR